MFAKRKGSATRRATLHRLGDAKLHELARTSETLNIQAARILAARAKTDRL